MKAHETGRLADEAAARHLERAGWTILERRYRVRLGEIDLVAERGEILAFVEVKSRSPGGLDDGRGAVDGRKRRRLVRAARHYLCRHGMGERPCRFDVVVVVGRPDSFRIEHLPGAFDES